MKDWPTDLGEQIDSLLHLNKNGCLTQPIPGLAVELLEKCRARLVDTLGADHSQALIREEQKGYDKGLADARAEAEQAVRSAPCLDENGYICEKAAILTALNGTSSLSRPNRA